MSSTLKDLEQKEKEIIEEADRIERAEENIKREEKKILEAEKNIASSYQKNSIFSLMVDRGLSTKGLGLVRNLFARRVSKHRLVFALIATTGVVLIWRGIWHAADELPIISGSLISLGVGVLLIWLIKKYTDLH